MTRNFLILIAAVFFLAACGRAINTATPEPGVSPTSTNTSEAANSVPSTPVTTLETAVTVTPTATTTATGVSAPQSETTRMMRETLGYVFTRANDDPTLFRSMGESENIAFVPVFIELLFFTNVINPEVVPEIDNALGELPGHMAFWFGWFDSFPLTEVYGLEAGL
ncbi:MAG: hypothetical protein V3T78_03195 [Dehalococcoidia bacterium]